MGQMGSAPFASTRRRRRDGGAFSPLALFANGEAGAWYDPSDLTPEKVSWRRNLLTYSEQFDNSAWTKSNASITPNAGTAPDGSATADKLVENTAASVHLVRQDIAVAAGVSYAISMYAKAAERSVLFISPDGGSNTFWFDLANGTTGGTGAGSSTIQSVGNGWYRCVYLRTYPTTISAALLFYVSNSTSGTSYTGDGTSGVLVWGAQIEQSPTASSYQRITDFTSDFLAAFPQHALYQDSAGTTPVTALGQPVGLVIDKSKGGLANLGPELVTNGTFDSGTTGWTAGGTTTLQVTNGVMRATGTTDGAYFGQQINVVSGRTYRLSATFGNDGTSKAGQINLGTALGTANRGSVTSFGFGLRQVVYTATATETLWIWFYPGFFGSSNYLLVDDVTVREVPGSHLIQATSASRPTCDARVNLLTYSEQLENAYWSTSRASIAANAAVAPNGTTTADRFSATSNDAYLYVSAGVSLAATSYRFGVYAKADSANAFRLDLVTAGFGLGASCTFTLTGAGTASSVTHYGASSGFVASITSEGNGWYFCTLTGSATATTWYPEMQLPTSGQSVFFWGADLRLASDAALPYQRVVTASDYADVQAPRYLTCDGIDDSLYTAASVDFATWTSGTRRNLLTYPSAFDNAAWVVTTGGGVTANTGVAPNGTTTADVLFAGSTGSFRGVYQVFTAANVAYTASVYAKASGKPSIGFVDYNGSGRAVQFDLTNGTISSAAVAGYTASIETIGNGWYRCSITATPAAGTRYVQVFIGDTGTSTTVTASGLDGVLLWGAQLELGSTATAFQDVGTDKMTVVTGVRRLSDAALGLLVELSANLGSNNGTFGLFAPSSPANVYVYEFDSRGTTTRDAQATGTAAPVTGVVTGLGDISGDIASVRVNGTVASTNTGDQGSGTYGTYVLYVGRRNNASNPFNGRLYQLIVRGAATDTATVQQTERFVAGKTGVTL